MLARKDRDAFAASQNRCLLARRISTLGAPRTKNAAGDDASGDDTTCEARCTAADYAGCGGDGWAVTWDVCVGGVCTHKVGMKGPLVVLPISGSPDIKEGGKKGEMRSAAELDDVPSEKCEGLEARWHG